VVEKAIADFVASKEQARTSLTVVQELHEFRSRLKAVGELSTATHQS